MANQLAKIRSSAFIRQRCRCYYCNSPIWDDDPLSFANAYKLGKKLVRQFQATAEHLTARMDGGGDSADNIVAACKFCNTQRHRLKHPPTPERFKQYVCRRINSGRWHCSRLFGNGEVRQLHSRRRTE